MYHYIKRETELEKVYYHLIRSEKVSLDIETTSLDYFTGKVLLLQLCFGEEIFILDCQTIPKQYIKHILSIIYEKNIRVYGHNLKFDLKFLYHNYEELPVNVYDTMLAEVLINQGVGEQYYSLEDLVSKYKGIRLSKEVRKSFVDHEGEFTESELTYAALDVAYLQGIAEIQTKQLEEQGQLKVLSLEMDLVSPVISMELNGVTLDPEKWRVLVEEAKEHLAFVDDRIRNLIVDSIDYSQYKNGLELFTALRIPVKTKRDTNILEMITDLSLLVDKIKENFNIASHTQIKAILNLLGISVDSTNEKVLKDWKEFEIVSLLLEYREYQKKITTYGENFLNILSPDSKLHVEFNQLGTETGRFSAARIHQIPRDNKYREAFIADPDYVVITADYSQIELRLAGEISGEEEFIHAYQTGTDLHKKTASFLFHKPVEDVTKDERNKGKTLNFAVGYGSTEYGLQANFGIGIEEAREYLKNFFAGYPRFAKFIELAGNEILKRWYSTTLLGRKRYFEKRVLFSDSREAERYYARTKREGINHIIQGTSADMTKKAICYMFYNNPFDKIYSRDGKFKIIMQVHDEIVVMAHVSIAEEAEEFVQKCMVDAGKLFLKRTPCEVDSHIASCWTK